MEWKRADISEINTRTVKRTKLIVMLIYYGNKCINWCKGAGSVTYMHRQGSKHAHMHTFTHIQKKTHTHRHTKRHTQVHIYTLTHTKTQRDTHSSAQIHTHT